MHVDEGLRARNLRQLDGGVDRDVALVLRAKGQMAGADPQRVRAVAIFIFAIIVAIIGIRTGSFSFFNEEGLLRRLSETISFLHYQALADQRMYQLEIDLGTTAIRSGS